MYLKLSEIKHNGKSQIKKTS